MKCSYCEKNIYEKLSFSNLFAKKDKILCVECEKIFTINSLLIDEYILFYFTNYENIKEDIYSIKYFGDVEKSLKYKKLLNRFLKKNKFDLITIAPTNFTRQAIRGFNHIEIICKLCDVNFEKIFTSPYRQKQAKLHEKRQFHKINIIKEKIKCIEYKKNILIIDDIFTSGKTLLSLANEIKKYNKTANITFLVLAKS